MLLTQTKNHYSYPILDNGISSFYHLYNDNSDRHHYQQHYLSESSSSPSLTDPNYLHNHGTNLDTTIEIETNGPSPYLSLTFSLISCLYMILIQFTIETI